MPAQSPRRARRGRGQPHALTAHALTAYEANPGPPEQRLGYVRGGAAYPLLKGERASGTCKAVLFAWRVVAALAPHVLVEIGLPNL